jgi:hypothetical protein
VDTEQPPIGYGAAVQSTISGEGWCAGIFSATKTTGCKVFIAVYSPTQHLLLVPVQHAQLRGGCLIVADEATMADMQEALMAATTLKTAAAYASASFRAVRNAAGPPDDDSTPARTLMIRRHGNKTSSSTASLSSESGGRGEAEAIDPAARAATLNVKQLRELIGQLGHKAPSRAKRQHLEAQLAEIRGEVVDGDVPDSDGESDETEPGMAAVAKEPYLRLQRGRRALLPSVAMGVGVPVAATAGVAGAATAGVAAANAVATTAGAVAAVVAVAAVLSR